MKTTRSWLLAVLGGLACAPAANRAPNYPEDHPAARPSPARLVARYVASRRALTQVRPNVWICVQGITPEDSATMGMARSATSVRIASTCRGLSRDGEDRPLPLLLVHGISMGRDTLRVFATYYRSESPREWPEEFVYYWPHIVSDWRIIVGSFAPPD